MFNWLIQKIVKGRWDKLVKGAGTTAVAYLAPLVAKNSGFELTAEQQAALAITVGAAIVKGSNWLKHAFPSQLGWL